MSDLYYMVRAQFPDVTHQKRFVNYDSAIDHFLELCLCSLPKVQLFRYRFEQAELISFKNTTKKV